jgi:hypothetical protein
MDIATEAETFRAGIAAASLSTIDFPDKYIAAVHHAAEICGITRSDAVKFVTAYYRGMKMFPCDKPVGIAKDSVLAVFSSEATHGIAYIRNSIHVGTVVDERTFIYSDHCSTSHDKCLQGLARTLTPEAKRTYRKLLRPTQVMKTPILQDLICGFVMCMCGSKYALEIRPSNSTVDIFIFGDDIVYETVALDALLTKAVHATEKFIETGESVDIEGAVKVQVARNQPSINQCRICCRSPPEVTLRTCSKCKKARYCSTECQRVDYPDHKKIC